MIIYKKIKEIMGVKEVSRKTAKNLVGTGIIEMIHIKYKNKKEVEERIGFCLLEDLLVEIIGKVEKITWKRVSKNKQNSPKVSLKGYLVSGPDNLKKLLDSGLIKKGC